MKRQNVTRERRNEERERHRQRTVGRSRSVEEGDNDTVTIEKRTGNASDRSNGRHLLLATAERDSLGAFDVTRAGDRQVEKYVKVEREAEERERERERKRVFCQSRKAKRQSKPHAYSHRPRPLCKR